MTHSGRNCLLLCAAAGAFLFTASCGTKGPEPPKPGTPPFIWGVAQDAYKAGDYPKAMENLDQLARGKSEYAGRSAPLKLMIGAGLAKGYIELAAKFDIGGKTNRENPGPFRKQVTAFRTQARAIAVQTLETVHQYLNPSKDEKITLVLPFPPGNSEEVAALKRVTSGLVLPPAEVEKVARETLQRNVIQVASQVAGSPKDLDKAKAVFSGAETQIPRAQFVLAIASALYDISDLFTPTKLDEPDKLKLICEEALEALGTIPQSKERKDLTDKLQKQLKKIRSTRG